MSIIRHRWIAPLAIGAAALSVAGTGAAFAASGAHTAPTTAITRHVTTAAELKAEHSVKETALDKSKDTTTDTLLTGPATVAHTKGAPGTGSTKDVRSTDTTTGVDR